MSQANDAAAEVIPMRPPSALVALIGPLAMFLGPKGSARRLAAAIVGTLLIALNHKLGLELDFNEQSLVAGVVVAVVIASNAKEATVAHAEARVHEANAEANATITAAQIAAQAAQVAVMKSAGED